MLEIRVWNSLWGIRFGIGVWDSGLDSGFGFRVGTKVRDSGLVFKFQFMFGI